MKGRAALARSNSAVVHHICLACAQSRFNGGPTACFRPPCVLSTLLLRNIVLAPDAPGHATRGGRVELIDPRHDGWKAAAELGALVTEE